MKELFAIVLLAHAAIHAIGFLKAFGIARVQSLKQPIGQPWGILWLLAAMAFTTGAILLFASPRFFWVAVGPAIVVSQVAIVASWQEAKLGTIVNVVVLVPLAMWLLELRSSSYRSIYEREVERALARGVPSLEVTDDDLSRLPRPVQTYLRRAGAVGRPHVHNFHVRFSGRMKGAPDAAWMPTRVEQHEFLDEPTRIFLARASRYGVPFEAFHLYAGPSATMRVKVASLVEIVDAKGPEMNRSETVTLFNDMCLLAPASLVDAHVEWREVDARKVVGTFTNAGNTIDAELTFDHEGDLVGFLSNDRYMSADGKVYERHPWSTPVGDYRDYGGVRLASTGDAIWKLPSGDFTYAHFVIESIEYNVGSFERPRVSMLP